METPIDRRTAVTVLALGAAALTGVPATASQASSASKLPLKGRLKHSACRWCYGNLSLEELCSGAAAIGMHSVELLGPEEWPIAKKHGLTCAVGSPVKSNPINRGFNRVEHHDDIVRDLEERLPLCAAAGIPTQIIFSGNRAGLADAEGIENCIIGLKHITPLAEKLGVTLIMELLNRTDHGDYHADRTSWGVQVVDGVGSDRFKLLYDIYHQQRTEGEVIATIRANLKHIGHFHTGGVPGRNEIAGDPDTRGGQELNYAAICKAIADAGYTGFIGQEFIPKREPMRSLREAVELCDQ
jgi:hydroxypyruvate isomerase